MLDTCRQANNQLSQGGGGVEGGGCKRGRGVSTHGYAGISIGMLPLQLTQNGPSPKTRFMALQTRVAWRSGRVENTIYLQKHAE